MIVWVTETHFRIHPFQSIHMTLFDSCKARLHHNSCKARLRHNSCKARRRHESSSLLDLCQADQSSTNVNLRHADWPLSKPHSTVRCCCAPQTIAALVSSRSTWLKHRRTQQYHLVCRWIGGSCCWCCCHHLLQAPIDILSIFIVFIFANNFASWIDFQRTKMEQNHRCCGKFSNTTTIILCTRATWGRLLFLVVLWQMADLYLDKRHTLLLSTNFV